MKTVNSEQFVTNSVPADFVRAEFFKVSVGLVKPTYDLDFCRALFTGVVVQKIAPYYMSNMCDMSLILKSCNELFTEYYLILIFKLTL